MRSKRPWEKVVRLLSMKGSISMMPTKMTMIFGTKVSVISCIEVSAWNSAMARPTTSASSMTGAPIFSMTTNVSRPISMASVTFTGVPSDGHAQDFLVRMDHLVAQGEHGLQRLLGLRLGHNNLGEIGRADGRVRLEARHVAQES